MYNGANASLALMSNFLRRKKRDTGMDQKDRDIHGLHSFTNCCCNTIYLIKTVVWL